MLHMPAQLYGVKRCGRWLVLEVTQMRPASTTPERILKFPVQTCSYLGEALRALLVLEVRQLRLEGRNPCERTPAHLPEGATACALLCAHRLRRSRYRCTGRAAKWCSSIAPAAHAPRRSRQDQELGSTAQQRSSLTTESSFLATSGLRCSTSKSVCLSLEGVINSVYSDS